MSRTVNITEDIIFVSHGEDDMGKLAALATNGKFHPSVIPVIDDLQDQITKEGTARKEADKQLQNNLDAEVLARTNADAKLQGNIEAEATVRDNADKDLQDKITAEVADRTAADQNLQDQVTKEVTDRADGDTTLQSNIDAEVAARNEADAKLQANIDAEANARIAADITISAGIVPVGSIVMWSGSVNSIPANWALCNGSNGTPNLLDRMVVCAGNSYAVGATGGEVTHTLTISEMPSHNHSVGWWQNGGNLENGAGGITTDPINEGWNDGTSGDIKIGNTGNSQSHNNMPPYYALAYIMRTA